MPWIRDSASLLSLSSSACVLTWKRFLLGALPNDANCGGMNWRDMAEKKEGEASDERKQRRRASDDRMTIGGTAVERVGVKRGRLQMDGERIRWVRQRGRGRSLGLV